MELKSYCFPLKEPNPLILEIFLVSKSEKVKLFKLQFEPILAVMQVNKSSSFSRFFVFDNVTHWESTDVSTRLSDNQILAHFTVESLLETISPPLKKVLQPSKKIQWILSICQKKVSQAFYRTPIMGVE